MNFSIGKLQLTQLHIVLILTALVILGAVVMYAVADMSAFSLNFSDMEQFAKEQKKNGMGWIYS